MPFSSRCISGALLSLLLLVAGLAELHAQPASDTLAALTNPVPLFRSNAGQWSEDVLFRSSVRGATVSFLRDGISVAATRAKSEEESGTLVWNVHFRGASSGAEMIPEEGRSGATYIRGAGGAAQVHHPVDYTALSYRSIYPGVDLRFHTGENGGLKYDCIVHPNGRVGDVAMQLDGVEGLRVESDGRLTVATRWGEVQEEKPYAYQIVDGRMREVEVHYTLIDNATYGFTVVGDYDRDRDLIIDPIILAWSTFIGGVQTDGYIYEIALDKEGNVYAVGFNHEDFPTTPGAYARTEKPERSDEYDAVIFKMSSDGKRLLASTYIGSTGSDYATDIALTPSGEVWVCGYTMGNDFPGAATTPSWQYNGTDAAIFLVRLDTGLTTLRYSALVGGNANYNEQQGILGSQDQPRLELAANGDVVLASTVSRAINAPAGTPGFSTTTHGQSDILICRISADGSRVVYAGYLGGRYQERFSDLTLGTNDDPFVVGFTRSNDIQTTPGAFLTAFPGGRTSGGIIAHVASDGRALLYSTIFQQEPITVAVYPTGEAVVGGGTTVGRYDMPVTAGVFDNRYDNTQEGFVAKFSADGRSLVFCTLIGDRSDETVEDIILRPDQIILALRAYDRTGSGTFPEITCTSTRMIQVQNYDFFVCTISPDARQFRLSIPFSGEDNDYVGHLQMVEESQELVVGLTTHSPDFPTTPGSYQTVKLNGQGQEPDQMVLMKLKPKVAPNFSFTVDSCGNASFTDLTPTDCFWGVSGWTPTAWRWDFGDSTGSTQSSPSHVYTRSGRYTVKLVVGSPTDSITRTVNVQVKARPTSRPDFSVVVDSCGTARFIDRTPPDCFAGVPNWRPTSWHWDFGDSTSSGSSAPTHVYATPGQYRVKLVIGKPADSITRTIVVPSFASPTVMTAHIDRNIFAGGGDQVMVPIILDDDPAAIGLRSIMITLRYDTLMAYPVGLDSTGLDSLPHGTLLEGWRLVSVDTLPGALSFRFISDTSGALTGPGTLMRVRFGTFISARRYLELDSTLNSELPFDISMPGRCVGAETDPGLIHLTVCGLQYRLIELVGEGNKYAVDPVEPNPFTSFAAIPFSLGLDGPTRLEIRDVSGRLVTTLVNQYLPAGGYRLVWDARGAAPGVYFYRLVSGDWSRTGTLHLVR